MMMMYLHVTYSGIQQLKIFLKFKANQKVFLFIYFDFMFKI